MLNNQLKILVLGGNGFIGKNLKEYLQSNTSLEIISPSRQQLNLLDDEACKVFLNSCLPDYIVHCAVDLMSVENTLKMFFNIYNNRASFGTLIQLGSGAEYDKRAYYPKMTEQQFGKSIPIDTYGMSKYLIARELNSSPLNNIINIRLFGVFGKYEDYSRRFISNNICRILVGLPVSINKNMFFDYIHVDDLGRLVVKLFDCMPLKSIDYNFCTGSPLSLVEIGGMIQRIMGHNEPLLIKQSGFNEEYSGNPKKIIDEIGGFEFTKITSSITKLVNYYRDNLTKAELQKFKDTQ